eukprot:TRINITY_DN12401_c0_g1_i1.p1 TRINITY_DN12401_c0_g1~~TRINITY_DN12401_c0_g1_i1.p1  ORF type:complete len:1112 (+),score=292.43 TRINITY_DN12401_c0_g1_i1:103-3438(+)
MEVSDQVERLLFPRGGVIPRSSKTEDEFTEFRAKLQSLGVGAPKSAPTSSLTSATLNLPTSYDPRYRVNFALLAGNSDHLSEADDAEYRDARHSLHLFTDFLHKRSFNRVQKLLQDQQDLPMSLYRDEILTALDRSQVLIVSGDTGCGKSTQLPQYLLRAGYKRIVCTQPRRIAAVSLSRRVTYETMHEYGDSVGFQIRFSAVRNRHTRIVFATEGVLLRQLVHDETLRQYNVVIADEVHERHISTDLLLALMKRVLPKRPDMKLILMSATINVDTLSAYFNNAPVVQVPGRLYPITVRYQVSDAADAYADDNVRNQPPTIDGAASTRRPKLLTKAKRLDPTPYLRILSEIDATIPATERGDVLVFVPGMYEIELLTEAITPYADQTKRWIVLQLHSTLSIDEQDKVFDIAPQGVRKVILSTNIAETSVTIDGVRFVIDSGRVKEMSHDRTTLVDSLQEYPIARAAAEQRKGRAGRTGPGVCYRMYSRSMFERMPAFPQAEIHRNALEPLMLDALAAKVQPYDLDLLEPPSRSEIDTAVQSLLAHGAFEIVSGADGQSMFALTPLGKVLSTLPVDLPIAKCLVVGSVFGIAQAVLPVAAGLAVPVPFMKLKEGEQATHARRDFDHRNGDALTLHNAFVAWLQAKSVGDNTRRWARHRGLMEQRLYEMVKLRDQFAELLADANLRVRDASSRRRGGADDTTQHLQLKSLQMQPRKRRVLVLRGNAEDDGSGSDDANDSRMNESSRGKRSERPKRKRNDSDTEQADFAALEFQLKHGSSVHAVAADLMSDHERLVTLAVCAGLYPHVAIADDTNYRRKDSDMAFHTRLKSNVQLHPSSVFASSPESIREEDCLFFGTLLETQKPYLTNITSAPALHTLLLVAGRIDTDADCKRIVVDGWLLLELPEEHLGQAALAIAHRIRLLMQLVLKYRLAGDDDDLIVPMRRIRLPFDLSVPDWLRTLAEDWVDESVGVEAMAGELYHRTCTFLSSPVKCKVSRIKQSEQAAYFFMHNVVVDGAPASTADAEAAPADDGADQTTENTADAATESVQTVRKLSQGIRITDWLTYDTVRPTLDTAMIPEYMHKHWTCDRCEKSFLFSAADVLEHQASCVMHI